MLLLRCDRIVSVDVVKLVICGILVKAEFKSTVVPAITSPTVFGFDVIPPLFKFKFTAPAVNGIEILL